jgi:phosphatidylserine/phosphatidylglycerophosphate/cardiolipin synthase-like enzyme
MQTRAYSVLMAILLVGGLLIFKQWQQGGGSAGGLGLHVPMAAGAPAGEDGGISVYFSPHGGCEEAVVSQINNARQTIDIQAYSFTSHPIADALISAEARGVKVRAILDKTASEERESEGNYIEQQGVPTYTDGEHPIAHNKVIILDQQTIITGSFNYTHQAETANAENLLILTNRPSLASAYERNFEEHLSHSFPLVASMENSQPKQTRERRN